MNSNTHHAHRVRTVTSLAAILLSLPVAALANPPALAEKTTLAHGRYASVHIGSNHPSDWPGRLHWRTGSVEAGLDLKGSANIGLALGKERGLMRYEVEYQHGGWDIEGASLGTRSDKVHASGHYDVLTVNVLRRAIVNHAVSLYGGAGVGIGRSALPHVAFAAGCACLPKADKTGLVVQLKAGAEHRVSRAGLVFGQLAYLKVPGPQSDSTTWIKYRSKGFTVLSIGYRHQF